MTRTKQEALTALLVEAHRALVGSAEAHDFPLPRPVTEATANLTAALALLGVPDELIRQRPLFREVT